MLVKDQQESLKNLLLMPIKVDKLAQSIQREKDIIISPQSYKGIGDPDMSDLSVTFYEIVYRDILPANHLLGTGENDSFKNSFEDPSFAGDTMNSFNTIAGKLIRFLKIGGVPMSSCYYMPDDSAGRLRLILASDVSKETKDIFKKFYALYHSLANFWVIPLAMGRTSPKKVFIGENWLSTQDYMWKFLTYLKENWTDLQQQSCLGKFEDSLEQQQAYFNKFEHYQQFVEKHCIDESIYKAATKDKTSNRGALDEKQTIEAVKDMIAAIEKRAELLSKSRYNEELWHLLSRLIHEND